MGAGGHGGFGNTGGSKNPGNDKPKKKPRTIDDNVKEMKKDYPYTKDGYFGKKGRNSRVIETGNPEATSVDFFKKIGKGGFVDELPNGKGLRITFADGTVVTHRLVTKTPNSPAVDINISHSNIIKSQKVHFIKEGK
ncbi:MAG: hypothetical protein J6H21_00315 [Firmicutes bacterium]|nr:hypothetical protein [Bacillota bacterium]